MSIEFDLERCYIGFDNDAVAGQINWEIARNVGLMLKIEKIFIIVFFHSKIEQIIYKFLLPYMLT